MNFFSFVLIAVLALSGPVQAQSLSLDISFINSEQSKDSHTTSEMFSIKGKSLVYTVKYSGRRGPNQKDEEKNCVLTDSMVNKISQLMNEKKLIVVDSLVIPAPADGAPSSSVAISILGTKDKKPVKIRIKGDPSVLDKKPLYENSLSLIYSVMRMTRNCK